MKKQLLNFLLLIPGALLTAQTQLNVATNFTDFAISTGTANPIVLAGTSPVSVTGTNCATGFFQKLYPAGQTCDSIVATYQIKTNIGSSITNYGQAVPAGTSNKHVKITNATQFNVGFSLQFCGTHDTISFSNLLVMAYAPVSVGINENRNEIAKHIYAANKTVFIPNANLDGLFISVHDLIGREVYYGNASEKTSLGLNNGMYVLTLLDKEKSVIAVKKLYLE